MATTLREYLDKAGVLTLWGKIKALFDNVAFIGSDDGQGVIADGGEGEENVIEVVKVNGTALTPDSNKAVNVQIKTINNQSLVGTGNINIQGGSGGSGDENVIESITFNGAAVPVDGNKNAAITASIPTALSELSGDSTHRLVTDTEKSTWNGKQDAISDLATIRSNAAAGAAKESNVQSDWNATSGAAVILNKPTIPAAVTESTVSGWGFTKNAGTYSKPSGGIPKTDMESDVQASLSKADSALQSYTETDPTVPAWAKAATKPSYTPEEVGALPATTSIPTKVSDLTNDAGYVTDENVVTIYSGSTAPSSSLGNNGDIYIQTS